MSTDSVVRVLVVNADRQVITDARVSISSGSEQAVDIPFDRRTSLYTARDLSAGLYRIAVAAPGLEAQEREVTVAAGETRETFVLGQPGLDYYYAGQSKVPFVDRSWLAIATATHGDHPIERIFDDLKVKLPDIGITPVDVAAAVKAQRVYVFQVPTEKWDAVAQLERLAAGSDSVRAIGAVVSARAGAISFLTNEICVKLKPGAQMPALVAREGLTVVRNIPYVENGWLLRGNNGSRAANRVCNRLAADPAVVWAEPNLFSTTVPATTDLFFDLQPHHTLIRSADAWVYAKGGGTRVAIIDGGCKVLHEDLSSAIVISYNMEAPGNPVNTDKHGTMCAGIAAATMDNCVGVAGVAGNASLMAIQMRSATDTDFADTFLWAAGLAPLSAGFAAPPSPGADVFNCSWSAGTLPLPALLATAFEQLRTAGRGGKGCVVVFAAGNQVPNGENFTTINPWAWTSDHISVGASQIPIPITNAERKVSTSNFGAYMDVCAPGGEAAKTAVQDRTLTTFSELTPETAFPTPYTDTEYALFGETSCACAQVAGVAALMLSSNGNLTSAEVRQILRDTAVKIDFGNTDPVGVYDAGGHSLWYGYGRIDARAAVQEAVRRRSAWAMPWLIYRLLRIPATVFNWFVCFISRFIDRLTEFRSRPT